MLDWLALDHPTLFPHGCITCRSQKGPILDTHVELPGFGRVYFCQSCVKTGARVLGLVKGPRLEELSKAVDSAHAMEQEREKAQEALDEAKTRIASLELEARMRGDEMDTMREHVAQLEGTLAEQAAAAQRATQLIGA